MAHPDPWSAIVAELTEPAVERPTPTAPSGDPRPVPVISRGHPFSARPETLRALKATVGGGVVGHASRS
jgi:hypothetical protein